ncbi:hypothetical protein BGZ83_006112 [Gryganskiella cystojenkinii]|nr:hypothetical protein BGZ83_006112 [Gryganskiella cystojenkinii]
MANLPPGDDDWATITDAIGQGDFTFTMPLVSDSLNLSQSQSLDAMSQFTMPTLGYTQPLPGSNGEHSDLIKQLFPNESSSGTTPLDLDLAALPHLQEDREHGHDYTAATESDEYRTLVYPARAWGQPTSRSRKLLPPSKRLITSIMEKHASEEDDEEELSGQLSSLRRSRRIRVNDDEYMPPTKRTPKTDRISLISKASAGVVSTYRRARTADESPSRRSNRGRTLSVSTDNGSRVEEMVSVEDTVSIEETESVEQSSPAKQTKHPRPSLTPDIATELVHGEDNGPWLRMVSVEIPVKQKNSTNPTSKRFRSGSRSKDNEVQPVVEEDNVRVTRSNKRISSMAPSTTSPAPKARNSARNGSSAKTTQDKPTPKTPSPAPAPAPAPTPVAPITRATSVSALVARPTNESSVSTPVAPRTRASSSSNFLASAITSYPAPTPVVPAKRAYSGKKKAPKVMTDWWLECVNTAVPQELNVCVHGQVTEPRPMIWHTSYIDQALEPLLLATRSGSLYNLKGTMDQEKMTRNGLQDVIKTFAKGFPENWKELLIRVFSHDHSDVQELVEEATPDIAPSVDASKKDNVVDENVVVNVDATEEAPLGLDDGQENRRSTRSKKSLSVVKKVVINTNLTTEFPLYQDVGSRARRATRSLKSLPDVESEITHDDVTAESPLDQVADQKSRRPTRNQKLSPSVASRVVTDAVAADDPTSEQDNGQTTRRSTRTQKLLPVAEKPIQKSSPVVGLTTKTSSSLVEKSSKTSAPVVEKSIKPSSPVVEKSTKKSSAIFERFTKSSSPVIETPIHTPSLVSEEPNVERMVAVVIPVTSKWHRKSPAVVSSLTASLSTVDPLTPVPTEANNVTPVIQMTGPPAQNAYVPEGQEMTAPSAVDTPTFTPERIKDDFSLDRRSATPKQSPDSEEIQEMDLTVKNGDEIDAAPDSPVQAIKPDVTGIDGAEGSAVPEECDDGDSRSSCNDQKDDQPTNTIDTESLAADDQVQPSDASETNNEEATRKSMPSTPDLGSLLFGIDSEVTDSEDAGDGGDVANEANTMEQMFLDTNQTVLDQRSASEPPVGHGHQHVGPASLFKSLSTISASSQSMIPGTLDFNGSETHDDVFEGGYSHDQGFLPSSHLDSDLDLTDFASHGIQSESPMKNFALGIFGTDFSNAFQMNKTFDSPLTDEAMQEYYAVSRVEGTSFRAELSTSQIVQSISHPSLAFDGMVDDELHPETVDGGSHLEPVDDDVPLQLSDEDNKEDHDIFDPSPTSEQPSAESEDKVAVVSKKDQAVVDRAPIVDQVPEQALSPITLKTLSAVDANHAITDPPSIAEQESDQLMSMDGDHGEPGQPELADLNQSAGSHEAYYAALEKISRGTFDAEEHEQLDTETEGMMMDVSPMSAAVSESNGSAPQDSPMETIEDSNMRSSISTDVALHREDSEGLSSWNRLDKDEQPDGGHAGYADLSIDSTEFNDIRSIESTRVAVPATATTATTTMTVSATSTTTTFSAPTRTVPVVHTSSVLKKSPVVQKSTVAYRSPFPAGNAYVPNRTSRVKDIRSRERANKQALQSPAP